jgi:hypothetical protein
MHRDSLVQKRLDELSAKGAAIAGAKFSVVTNPRTGRTADRVSNSETQGWSTSVMSLLHQAFGEDSVHCRQFRSIFEKFDGYLSSFKTLYAVFSAAKEDYEGGYLFNLRGLVKAEVLSDALEQADELLHAGYKDPACVLAGVSLEIAVKELAARQAMSPAKLDKMNVDLCKAGVYNLAKQKQVTAWADLRNKAAHGDWVAYSSADVRDMLAGVQRFIADHL